MRVRVSLPAPLSTIVTADVVIQIVSSNTRLVSGDLHRTGSEPRPSSLVESDERRDERHEDFDDEHVEHGGDEHADHARDQSDDDADYAAASS